MINKKVFKRCFSYPKRQFHMNIKRIPEYVRETRFLKKNGYDITAQWATCAWFTEVMKEILTFHRYHRHGAPMLIPSTDKIGYSEAQNKLNEQKWNSELDKMLVLLDDMDEDNPKYEEMVDKESFNQMVKAKDEFFSLFSKYFYDLWD